MFERGKIGHFAPGEGITAGAHAVAYDDDDWLDVPIPGGAHRALIAAGQIPDPFYDRNETACAWMEEREWWYRIPFDRASGAARRGRAAAARLPRARHLRHALARWRGDRAAPEHVPPGRASTSANG